MITLKDFEHLRTDKRIRFKDELVDGVDLTIIAYMIADTDMWAKPLSLETRGITFDTATGECLSRPFTKFFNLNENEWTQVNAFDFSHPTIVADKRDGSMLTPVLVNDKVFWKTKKSFFSDVAIHAATVAASVDGLNEWCKVMCKNNCTPIFEFTSPQNKVVIDYGEAPQFTLLAIRSNVTGDYTPLDSITSLPAGVNVIRTEVMHNSVDTFIKSIKDMSHIEGFVLTALHKETATPTMFKVKTQWYSDNHHVMTDLRERDVAVAVLNESIDDIKSLVATSGVAIDKIEAIEHRVVQQLSEIVQQTESLCELMHGIETRKEIAMLYKNNKFFSLAIRLLDDGEPDYKKFFTTHYLKVDYSLTVVYNPSFSKDA